MRGKFDLCECLLVSFIYCRKLFWNIPGRRKDICSDVTASGQVLVLDFDPPVTQCNTCNVKVSAVWQFADMQWHGAFIQSTYLSLFWKNTLFCSNLVLVLLWRKSRLDAGVKVKVVLLLWPSVVRRSGRTSSFLLLFFCSFFMKQRFSYISWILSMFFSDLCDVGMLMHLSTNQIRVTFLSTQTLWHSVIVWDHDRWRLNLPRSDLVPRRDLAVAYVFGVSQTLLALHSWTFGVAQVWCWCFEFSLLIFASRKFRISSRFTLFSDWCS